MKSIAIGAAIYALAWATLIAMGAPEERVVLEQYASCMLKSDVPKLKSYPQRLRPSIGPRKPAWVEPAPGRF